MPSGHRLEFIIYTIEIAGLTAKRDAALEAEKDYDHGGTMFPKSADIKRSLEFESKALTGEAKAKREIENGLDWYVRTFMRDDEQQKSQAS